MRFNPSKVLVPIIALALVASACHSGGGKRPTNPAADLAKAAAKDVHPPERLDPKNIAQPGLTLATNSPTWEHLVGAPNGRGAVVLFVLPGGPAADKGIARGDMITEVDGKRVTNQENALTLLRGSKGEKKKIKFLGRNGKTRTLEVKGALPKRRARTFLNAEITGNSSDPVLHYLRAQSVSNCNPAKVVAGCGTIADNLADLDVALKQQPEFVEALAARANITFNRRLLTKDAKQRTTLANQALANWSNALAIDPRNAETLVLQSNAETAIGQATAGKTDAQKALRVDPSIPSANHALARAELALKKPDLAAGPAAAAIQLNPYSNLTYYRTLAEVFKDLKRKADCAATLNAVVPYLEGTKVKALKTEAEHLQGEAKTNCG